MSMASVRYNYGNVSLIFLFSWREKEGQLCRSNADCNWLHEDLKVIQEFKRDNHLHKETSGSIKHTRNKYHLP